MKIVKFKDGLYGIKKGNWFTGYSYKDLTSMYDYWWSDKEYYCKGSWGLVSERYKNLIDEYGN